jgi:3-methyladenine DNA glycosylase AlkD
MSVIEIIKELKIKVRTRENGPASEAMGNLGVKYKKNHGLSVQQIKVIAEEHKNNHDLAIALHKENTREFMLMSFIIENPVTVSFEQIEEWVSELKDTEQAEQIAINLLVFNNKFYSEIVRWSQSDNEYIRRMAFVLIARIAMLHKRKFDFDIYEEYIELCRTNVNDEKIHVAKAISWALRRIGRIETSLYNLVYETAEEIGFLKTNYTQLISEEVLYELNDGMIKSMIR